MKQLITTCDICGQELGRWYEVFVRIDAKYDWQNVADMIEIDGVPLVSIGMMERVQSKCLCKDCMTALVKVSKRMAVAKQSAGQTISNFPRADRE